MRAVFFGRVRVYSCLNTSVLGLVRGRSVKEVKPRSPWSFGRSSAKNYNFAGAEQQPQHPTAFAFLDCADCLDRLLTLTCAAQKPNFRNGWTDGRTAGDADAGTLLNRQTVRGLPSRIHAQKQRFLYSKLTCRRERHRSIDCIKASGSARCTAVSGRGVRRWGSYDNISRDHTTTAKTYASCVEAQPRQALITNSSTTVVVNLYPREANGRGAGTEYIRHLQTHEIWEG